MQKPCSLQFTIWSPSREGQCFSLVCLLPPSPSTISSCKLGPCFPSLLTLVREIQLQRLNPNAICTMLARWWLLRLLACTRELEGGRGCRVSSLLWWRAQQVPEPGQPAWFTTISSYGLCVCTYKYQPPTDNPLSQLQRSPPEPAWCLGFYHIYILYFWSRTCQWCIFKAFPSLGEGLWGAFCPGPAPPAFLLCLQIQKPCCQGGIFSDKLRGQWERDRRASDNDPNTENQHVFAEDFQLPSLIRVVPWLETQAYLGSFASLLICNSRQFHRE